MKKHKGTSYTLIGILLGIAVGLVLDSFIFQSGGIIMLISSFAGACIGAVFFEIQFLKEHLGKKHKDNTP